MPAVDAVLILPKSLRIDRGALGLAYATNIAGHAVLVQAPELPAGGSGRLRPARFPTGAALAPALKERHVDEWGHEAGDAASQVELLGAYVDRDSHDPAQQIEELKVVARGVSDWFDVLESWLASWLGVVDTRRTTSTGTVLAFLDIDGKATGYGGYVHSTIVGGVRGSSSLELGSALARAGGTERLPLEHALLLDARRHLDLGDHRRSVIDACTAAEAALATGVRGHTSASGLGSSVANSRKTGIMNLVGSYNRLAPSPLTARDDHIRLALARPRNQAAHAGCQLADTVAAEALAVARVIASEASPLPLA